MESVTVTECTWSIRLEEEGHRWPVEGAPGPGDEWVWLWYQPEFLLLNQQKLIRVQTRSPGTALSGPLLQQEDKNRNSFPCSFPRRGELVPYMERRWGRARGWLGWLACPLSVLRAGGMHSALLLRLAPQKWQWLKESKDLDNWRNTPGLGIRKTQYSQNHNSP